MACDVIYPKGARILLLTLYQAVLSWVWRLYIYGSAYRFTSFSKILFVFFVTFDFSPLYFILDASSSGFLGVCVCKVFGQTENDIIFLYLPCVCPSSLFVTLSFSFCFFFS